VYSFFFYSFRICYTAGVFGYLIVLLGIIQPPSIHPSIPLSFPLSLSLARSLSLSHTHTHMLLPTALRCDTIRAGLLCFTLLYSALLCCTLLYSGLLCCTLPYSALLCFTLLYSAFFLDFFQLPSAVGMQDAFAYYGGLLFFFGLYFGVLSRDCSEMCAVSSNTLLVA
jgi:hypothetical protein